MRNMGRLDFVPKPWYLLCIEHFATNCIDFRDLRAMFRKGSVPKIFNDDKENLHFRPIQNFMYLPVNARSNQKGLTYHNPDRNRRSTSGNASDTDGSDFPRPYLCRVWRPPLL
ncbi:uncharacterized protein [Fopius arisanus]|uniref:THAP-type domain-containing protein n=1 Tax=Fopius arisanus TaxID=64838 RepID=A0A9R1TPC5_9HYME|nr:PREDICTED: uncharacterized protein LOC105272293 [Fopius arisanus]